MCGGRRAGWGGVPIVAALLVGLGTVVVLAGQPLVVVGVVTEAASVTEVVSVSKVTSVSEAASVLTALFAPFPVLLMTIVLGLIRSMANIVLLGDVPNQTCCGREMGDDDIYERRGGARI